MVYEYVAPTGNYVIRMVAEGPRDLSEIPVATFIQLNEVLNWCSNTTGHLYNSYTAPNLETSLWRYKMLVSDKASINNSQHMLPSLFVCVT
jgi:hypothetical protein